MNTKVEFKPTVHENAFEINENMASTGMKKMFAVSKGFG
jgi:hypothetical protein